MIRHESYFVVRTPLFPYNMGNVLDSTTLRQKFANPDLQEAIYVASPGLYRKLKAFLESALSADEEARVCISLQKYLLRLSRRSTPFGLFAGVVKGTWGSHSHTTLSDKIVRHTRLDTNYAWQLADTLVRTPAIRNVIRFFPNNTLHSAENELRYIEYQVKKNHRVYLLSTIDNHTLVQDVLRHARNGSSIGALAHMLINRGVDAGQAAQLIEDMIDNQILISELEIRLTDGDYFLNIVNILRHHNITSPALEEICRYLAMFDVQPAARNLPAYQELTGRLHQLTNDTDSDRYIQVDACRTGTVELDGAIAGYVVKAIETLAQIMPLKSNKQMAAFRKAFFSRYERETVDLSIALDPEIGVGYPIRYAPHLAESTLLRDILFPDTKESAVFEESAFQDFLIRKYSEALAGKKNIILNEAELRPFMKPAKLPASLSAFVSVFAGTANHEGCDILFHGAYGPSAATLIARFCHLDSDLTDSIRRSLRREEQTQPGAVFAEIVHVNEARIGNISSRPVLRQYEIPILALGGVPADHQIPVSDLTLSLVDDRFVLRSKKLNCEVVPRLSSAHNYTHDTISVYRFLCDLQYDDIQSAITWEWGSLRHAPYLPSVRLGNVIVTPARWRIAADDLIAIKRASDLRSGVEMLRAKEMIPRYVLVGTGDNKIPIDLENDHQLIIFQKLLETTDTLEESVANGKNFFFHDADGSGYVNELIIPLENVTPHAPNKVDSASAQAGSPVTRNFMLGSEWLYYKIYCTTHASDRVLSEVVMPLASALLKDGVIDRWFYIRYSDPGNHIRLRFHGTGDFYARVIALLHSLASPLIESRLIISINTDVYRRELERYGTENIDASEQLFFIDSDCIGRLLNESGQDPDITWQLGLALIDQWFVQFDIPTAQRQIITTELQQQFFSEMRADQNTKRSLADTLRKKRQAVSWFIDGTGLPESIEHILRGRGERMRPVAQNIIAMADAGKLSVSVRSLLKSYIHMSINRLLPANQRQHEMVLYDFLHQLYHTQLRKGSRVSAPQL